MAFRRTAALAGLLLLSAVPAASARTSVAPRANALLSGTIKFPRAQPMSIRTDRHGSRLIATMGFDGRCKGGGLGEVFAANVSARPTVRVQNGRFAATLTGRVKNLGGLAGRVGAFRWRLDGHFVE